MTGKSTFITTISQCTGCISSIDKPLRPVFCGCISLDSTLTLLLYEVHNPITLAFLPGELLGALVMLHAGNPQTFREAHQFVGFVEAYCPVPFAYIANTGGAMFDEISRSHREYTADDNWDQEALRIALRIPSTSPIYYCNTRKHDEVKSALLQFAEHVYTLMTDEVENGINSPQDHFYSPKVLGFEQVMPTSQPDLHHRWLWVVNAEGYNNSAEDFMESLCDVIEWIDLSPQQIPRRWGYCDIDTRLRIHVFYCEAWSLPKNRVQFAIDNLVAMIQQTPPPNSVFDDPLNIQDTVLGCVAILNETMPNNDERILRLTEKLQNIPLVIVYKTAHSTENQFSDLTSRLSEAQTSKLIIIPTTAVDKDLTYRVMVALSEKFNSDYGEKLRRKYG